MHYFLHFTTRHLSFTSLEKKYTSTYTIGCVYTQPHDFINTRFKYTRTDKYNSGWLYDRMCVLTHKIL